MSSISNISNDQGTQLATAMMGLSVAKDTLQKYVGSDGMEFEIIYQALIDYMTSKSGDSNLNNLLNAVGTANNSNTISSEELKNMLNNATKYADSTNRVSNVATSESNKSEAVLNNLASTNASASSTLKASIDATIEKYAKKYGMDANLIRSVIKAESDFNPRCTSEVGAQGLMQLMPENSKYYGVTNPYDIDQNISAGTQLLKSYLNMYGGNTEMALAAYTAGPGTLQRRGVSSSSDFYKLPSETRHYVPKVMGYYNNL